MIPQASNFNSKEGASAWFSWRDPDTNVRSVYESQGKTIVKKAQSLLRQMLEGLGVRYFVFTDQAQCLRSSSSLEVFPAGILAEDTYQTVNANPTGVWSPLWTAALAQFLCLAGLTSDARQLAATAGGGPMIDAILRRVIWLAYFLGLTDLVQNGQFAQLSEAALKRGAAIELPVIVGFPQMAPVGDAQTITEDARDSGWTGKSTWGDPIPLPPSVGGGFKPWPEGFDGTVQSASSGGLGVGVILALAVGVGVVMRGKKRRR